MNLFSKVVVGALVPLTIFGVQPGQSSEIDIIRALDDVGVLIAVNNDVCEANPGMDGGYNTRTKEFIVCQDNAVVNNGEVVDFTDNDLDTIRHEAVHVIQDCRAGRLGDGALQFIFEDKNERISFVRNAYDNEDILAIATAYEEQGSHVIEMELEAWSAAKTIDASSIADGVRATCRF